MNEWKLFFGFFFDAARAATKNAGAVLFALIATVSSLEFFGSLFEKSGPFESQHEVMLRFFEAHPILLVILPILMLVSVFGESGLVLLLSDRKRKMKEVSLRALRIAPRLFSLEVLFVAFLVVLLVILSLPAMFVSGNETLATNLFLLGGLIFIPIAVLALFVKIYAAFHIILSGLRIKESITLAYALFSRNVATGIVFGTVSILVTILLSFLAGILLNGILLVPMTEAARMIIAFGFFLLYQGFLLFVQKGAWLSFFRFLATPKEPEVAKASQEKENVIQQELPQGSI